MAVSPIFWTRQALVTSLRLGNATQPGLEAVVDSAIQRVRVGMYDEVGESRINTLIAVGSVENPTTAAQVMRLKAQQAELVWVKIFLLKELPVLFMDASGNVRQDWNEDGLTRSANSGDLRALIDSLQNWLTEALADLRAGSNVEGRANISVIASETTPMRPGQNVFGYGQYQGNLGEY